MMMLLWLDKMVDMSTRGWRSTPVVNWINILQVNINNKTKLDNRGEFVEHLSQT